MKEKQKMIQTIPTAEPFFLPGKGKRSRIGCLLIHGFTGAPKEMRWMGDYLNSKGYTCLGIRLNGHATKPDDMIRSSYRDWMLSVEDGFNILKDSADRIFLIGLSMGGILSLLMSSLLNVDGVFAMSTPYQLPDDPRLKFIKLIARFIKYMPKSNELPGEGWFDKKAFQEHVSYPQNPVGSIAELNALMELMREAIPLITVPVFLVHSKNDDYVFKDSMQQIFDHLGSDDKQMMWVEGSSHVIPREPVKELVFETAVNFIEQVVKTS
ncbi:alpha/beta hydrolase [Chloroflexota bacterium]